MPLIALLPSFVCLLALATFLPFSPVYTVLYCHCSNLSNEINGRHLFGWFTMTHNMLCSQQFSTQVREREPSFCYLLVTGRLRKDTASFERRGSVMHWTSSDPGFLPSHLLGTPFYSAVTKLNINSIQSLTFSCGFFQLHETLICNKECVRVWMK